MNVDREQQKEILQILFDDFPWGTQKRQASPSRDD